LCQRVDQAVAFGKRNEARGRNGAEDGIVPADQRLDTLQAAIRERHLGLVDHVQPVVDEGPLEAVEKAELGRPDHDAFAGRWALRIASRASRRTGFSSGPTM
jgi:hypothetical protein